MIRYHHFLRQSPAAFPLAFLAGLTVLLLAPPSRAQEFTPQLDPVQTKIEFSLGSTVHTVHGTFALKSCDIRFDPTNGKINGTIVVDATSGESGDRPRDARMHREILESARFPEIVFMPTQLAGVVAPEGTSKVEVSGQFRLHGQEHTVTFPMEIKAQGANLQISSHIEIPYLQWRLKNPSNFLLRVSDRVAIDIRATGRLQPAENH
jgi:polyisoprenoid-binding protein YceI